MNPDQQQRLFKNIAAAMAGVPEEIVQRQLMHFQKADRRYADGVAKALGVKNRAAAFWSFGAPAPTNPGI